MATVTFNPLVAVDFATLNTVRSTVDLTNATSYDFDTSNSNDLDMEGTGLTFDGSSNVTGGTITRIDIDIAGDQPAVNGGDINISGLSISSTTDLGIIDNGAFSMFGVALQGNDSFLLSGFAEDADTPTVTSRLFGDDLANLILLVIGGSNTNTGGNDTFSGGDNRFEISGDAWNLDTSGGLIIGSTYNGGDDAFNGVVTEEFSRVAGDAWTIDRSGQGQMVLNGGDDDVDLGGNSSGSSWIAGDVNDMNNGVVNGGDDTLISDDSTTPEVAGDVRTYDGGTLNGGDDIISLTNFGRAGGDLMFLNSPVPAGVFTVTGGIDEITGGADGDVVAGDVYDRNSTVDNLIVGGDDVITGGGGDDSLCGEVAFGDAVLGVSGGNDVITGGSGNDTLRGQTGDDSLDGGDDNDTVDGGVGDDTISYATASAGVAVNLLVAGNQNTVGAGTDSLLGLEHLTGSRHDDTLRGNNVSNDIAGGRGNDQLFSGAGQDGLTAGSGNDTLNTVGQTVDVAVGNSGDDTFQADGGGNLLVGNIGLDTVSFATVAAASTIDLALGQARQNAGATADILFLIENATGGLGDDSLVGNAGANVLSGLDGNDEVRGGDGNDTLDGGVGDDTLFGEDDDDQLFGGDDADELDGGRDDDTLSGGGQADSLLGDRGGDELNGDDGSDTLDGGREDDTLNGGSGGDDLFGGDDVDVLNGGGANDTLDGGDDNDQLAGETGADTYTGGGGADTMLFAPTGGSVEDVIADFEDTGAIADDLVDVTDYGFASVASITATADGDDAILDFGGNDTVRLEDYLLTHVLSDIDAGDFIL